MKTNAIFRIIGFSLIICILLGVLIVGIGHDTVRILPSRETASAAGFKGSSGEVPANQIEEIKIQWVSGSVTVQSGTGDRIQFSETPVKESKQMVWDIDGRKLTVRFQESEKNVFGGFHANSSKDLTVTIPEGWQGKTFDIENVSSDIGIDNLSAAYIKLNTVSGKCNLKDCIAQDVSMETVSGKLYYSGNLESLKCSSVSADCEAMLYSCPSEVDMSGISGNLKLHLPADCGFQTEIETISGHYSCEFDTVCIGGNSRNGTYLHGDGACKISMEGVSGNVSILSHDKSDHEGKHSEYNNPNHH